MAEINSHDIISLIGRIDCIKRAADRYIQTKNIIANTSLNNSGPRDALVTNDIKEEVSNLGNRICDQLSPWWVVTLPIFHMVEKKLTLKGIWISYIGVIS